MEKKAVDLLIFLLAVVFVSMSISALSFTVQSSCQSDEKIVMKLSDTTNAHGELYDQVAYNNFLCSTDAGSHVCDGNNKVIGLSGATNAHGEIPENVIYNAANNVCFGSLRCVSSQGSCPVGHQIGIVSLSEDTNAHIGGFNDYNTKICCTDIETPDSYWTNNEGLRINSLSQVVPGTTPVKLVFKNPGLGDGETMTFNVERKNFLGFWSDVTSLSAPVNGLADEASTTWTIPADIGSGDEQLLFKATPPNQEEVISEILTITLLDPDYCQDNNILACNNYNDDVSCAEDPCNVIVDSIAGLVDCSEDLINCYCSFDASNGCEAAYDELTIQDEIRIVEGNCNIVTPPEGADPDGCADGKIEFQFERVCDGIVVDSGTSGYSCPAEVQLPFFGFYNFIVTMLVIALIYYFTFSHYNKKRKS